MSQSANNIPWYSSRQFQQKFIAPDGPRSGAQESFRILRIEDVIGYMKFPLPLHRTQYYDIMYISRGQPSSRHRGLKQYPVGPGQVFFKAAGQVTSGDVLDKEIEGYFCLVEEEFFTHTGLIRSPLASLPFFRYGNNPVVSLSPAEAQRFEFLLASMHQCYTTNDKEGGKNPVIAAYLNALLQEAALIHQAQNQDDPVAAQGLTTAETLTDRFKDLVAEHYLVKRQVKDYADLLFVTPNHLNKMVRKTTGKTALHLISSMLVMEAEILLQQTPMSVAEIASYLSFEDASYFIRFFRKQKGVTPGAYRKA
jgi:AraC family transcriptional activator of pobA